jgi:hypothetical protein
VSDFNGIHAPTGPGPLLDEMRALARSVADTLYVPGQALTDTGILTPGPAWTITSVELRQWLGPLYSLRVVAAYAADNPIALPTNPADGNIPNSVICTLLPEYRPAYNAPMQSYFAGPVAVGGVSSTTGSVSLGAVAPGSVISKALPFSLDLAGLMLCPGLPW